jgi:predicted RNA-binding Zn ribbon-like protein
MALSPVTIRSARPAAAASSTRLSGSSASTVTCSAGSTVSAAWRNCSDLQAPRAVALGSRLELQVRPDGQLSLGAEPSGQLKAQLLALLLVIRDVQRDRTWQRLKACGNPDCRWAFYDRSHSRAGAWCDMATCGGRIKDRWLRQRQR